MEGFDPGAGREEQLSKGSSECHPQSQIKEGEPTRVFMRE